MSCTQGRQPRKRVPYSLADAADDKKHLIVNNLFWLGWRGQQPLIKKEMCMYV